jgi:hypothetical protein
LVLGQGIGELSGSLDVSRVDAEVDGDPQDTIRQLYIASFSRNLTSAMNFRIGLRYFSFDLEELSGGNPTHRGARLDASLVQIQRDWFAPRVAFERHFWRTRDRQRAPQSHLGVAGHAGIQSPL